MPPDASTFLNRFMVRTKLRDMQILVRLIELGSMSRAAQASNMTQPAVSQLVAELESMLETDLFFRHSRGVEPTEAAMDLLPVARRILRALEDGVEAVANRIHEQSGVVRVSASPAAQGGMLQGKLDAFAQKYPDIQVHIAQTSDIDPFGGIAENAYDIVCTREPSIIPEGWTFERCMKDELIAVCGITHRFAFRCNIAIKELGQARWLQNRVGSVARDRFEEISCKGDWPWSARCQIIMHIPELTREMLLTGRYLAILPRSVATPWLRTGEVRELRTEINAPLAPLGFLWRKARAGSATSRLAAHITSLN